MRAPILLAATALTLTAGAAQAGPPNPDILVNQVGAAVTRSSVRVENLSSGRVSLTVSPVPAGVGPRTAMAQPQAALDRCEAVLRGDAAPMEGLDCSVGQLDALRQEVQAEAAMRPSLSLDIDRLSKDLESTTRTPQLTDPATGAPTIFILRPPG